MYLIIFLNFVYYLIYFFFELINQLSLVYLYKEKEEFQFI